MFGFNKKEKHGPKELNAFLSRLVADEWEKMPTDSDHWVKFMMVERPHNVSEDEMDIRIFDQWMADQHKIKIRDFAGLDSHPDLILFEGLYNKKAKKADLKNKKAA